MVTDGRHRLGELFVRGHCQRLRAEGDAHRGRHADSWRPSYLQFLDRSSDGLIVLAVQELDLLRQAALVQNPNRPVFPFDRRNHETSHLSDRSIPCRWIVLSSLDGTPIGLDTPGTR